VSIKPIKIRLSGNTQKQEDKEEAEREGEGTKESQNVSIVRALTQK